MKIAYKEWRPGASALQVVEQADAIVNEYQAQGFDLTLRQLYYQFVARGLIVNSEKEYKRIGRIVSDARLAGMLDWHAIVDRTRGLKGNSHWSGPEEIIRGAARGFATDKWLNQPSRVEVWVEKEALIGVVADTCYDLDVDYFACKGYVSQSEQWRGSQRYSAYAEADQSVIVVHLGDHDPSGIDMTRDITDRMRSFGVDVEVDRVALNMDQVRQYNPPPNPTKLSDSRAKSYLKEFGNESWELDALDPKTLAGVIEHAVLSRRDERLWEEAVREERKHKELLNKLPNRWDEVVTLLNS